jgi:hypothetical protein
MIHTISQFKHLDGHYLRDTCRHDIFQIWQGVCQVCGKKMSGIEEMDVGHRVPQSHEKFFNEIFGGEIDIHNLLNLQAEHINCNRAKKNSFFYFKPLLLESFSQSAQRIARYERKNKAALAAGRKKEIEKERVKRVVKPLDFSIYPILKHNRNEDFPELTRRICVYLYKNAKVKPVLDGVTLSSREFIAKTSNIIEVVKSYMNDDALNGIKDEPDFFRSQLFKIQSISAQCKYLSGKNNKNINWSVRAILEASEIMVINREYYIFYSLPFGAQFDFPFGSVKTEDDWLDLILTKPLSLSVRTPSQTAIDLLRKSGEENIRRVCQGVLSDPTKQQLIAPHTRRELEGGGLRGHAGRLAASAYAEEVYGADWHNTFLDLGRI